MDETNSLNYYLLATKKYATIQELREKNVLSRTNRQMKERTKKKIIV